MNVIIVSHESDVDGLFSASIALMRYPQAKILFTSYGKENFLRISDMIYKEVISSIGNGIVIFSDLGLNDDMIPYITDTLEFLKSNSWSILWVDHHPWSEKAIQSTRDDDSFQLILDSSGSLCASELMYRHFLHDNIVANQISRIAHTSDFLLKDHEIPPLPELIIYYKTLSNFYNKLSDLSSKISRGILWDTEMQMDFNKYVKLRDEAKLNSLKMMKLEDVARGMTMALIPVSSYIQTSLFSEEVFEKTKADLAIFYNQDGKVSIRRNNTIIECDKIAKQLLEGGGHKYAAGGRLISNPGNIYDISKELKNAIETSLNMV